MNPIETLCPSLTTEAMVFKHKGDDGLSIQWSHGRMQWYRTDTKYYIDLSSYSYWS